MSATPQKRSIDGVDFEVTPLGSKLALQLSVRLVKALGPSFAVAAGGAATLKGVDLPSLVMRAAQDVSVADLEWAAEILGETTRYSEDGGGKWPYLRGPQREVLFQGRMLMFFRWLAFALEVNYSDFFAVLRSPRE